MGKNDDRKHVHDLAVFALKALKVLEKESDNALAMGAIYDCAFADELGNFGAEGGHFQRTERGKRFDDTWYGPACMLDVPPASHIPEPGEHIERDYH